jgi:predicted DsbA family dithiol-disulfide isomerase
VRIERLEREYDVRVVYVNFPLHPETPAEGISLAELFGGEAALPRIRASQERLKQMAAAEGLTMSDRTMTYNSRLAQELGVWATEKGKGPAFHEAAFRAYFTEGKVISDPTVLAGIAAAVGLDPAEARHVMAERTYRDAVDREWAVCSAAGVTAVPTYEAGGRKVVGAQPYEQLARLVEQAGAKRRATRPDAEGSSK